MINPKTLQLGNYVYGSDQEANETLEITSISESIVHYKRCSDLSTHLNPVPFFNPIPLTEEWLLYLGFEKPPHFTVANSYSITISRNRKLIVSSVGTPNLMVALCAVDKDNIGTDIVVLHNWDYDKDIYVHDLQNIYQSISKQQLTLKK